MVCLVLAASCTSGDDAVSPTPPTGTNPAVVASFNFAESRLVAEIYAAALEHAGVPVRRELDLGPRELVSPALMQGHVDIVPEYLGTALASVAPSVSVDDEVQPALTALAAALAPMDIRVLTPAAAQNQNAIVVPRATADRLRLGTISDLVGDAPGLSLGGPPECPSRRYCLAGLTDVYGLHFARFVPLDRETHVVRALADGVIDVGVMFTTDGHLASGDLVVLEDDRHLQPPENIVPVVREEVIARHGEKVVTALDDVSSRLTTTALRLLNWRVSVSGRDPRTEARGWLVRQGVLPR